MDTKMPRDVLSELVWHLITHLIVWRIAMSLKKQYLKKTRACKVTFSLSKEVVGSAANVNLVGDFNDWSLSMTPMKRLKNGTFTATVTLQANGEYHFRYLVDGHRWENDWNADKYVPNAHGSDDSVVVL
jgi:1,4-alpha-glucan branching enzyme